MTPQKVLCARLILKKDGTTKKVIQAEGGGTRDCMLTHIDTGFDEIHDKLRDLFGIDPNDRLTKLYDFKCQELDTTRYRTFFEYVQHNGLKFRSILLYLCAPAGDVNPAQFLSPEKHRPPPPTNPVQVPLRVPQVEADSSTSPVIIQLDDEPSNEYKPSAESLLSAQVVQKLRISSTTPFTNYSFEGALNELVDYLRDLVHRHKRQVVFVELFEHLCTLQGLTSITLDRLKQQCSPKNEHERRFYDDALEKIDTLLNSIRRIIGLNKMGIADIDQHSVISKSFHQFQQNFIILREQWNQPPRSTSFSAPSHAHNPTTPQPHSSAHHTSSSSASSSRTHREAHRPSTARPNSTGHSSNAPRTSSFSFKEHRSDRPSSSRHQTDNTSRKQSRTLSPSPHRPHRSTVADPKDDERAALFRNIFRSLRSLSDVLHAQGFRSFYELIKRITNQVSACQSNVNLTDYQSLRDAMEAVEAIEQCLAKRINDEHHHAAPHKISRALEDSSNQTLDAIKHLLNDFQHCKSKINASKRPRSTRWSPPNAEPMHTESKPVIPSVERHRRTHTAAATADDDDDDQSSDASHSSVGDDVLMEVARDAYEQRPHRHA